MDGFAERGRAYGEDIRPYDRKGPTSQPGESSNASGIGSTGGRFHPESRRKRGNAQRSGGWRDGIERVYCSRAAHVLPVTFPVESHAGAATIAASAIARRLDVILLCNFSHHGPHMWPDGEVADSSTAASPGSPDG